MLSTCSMRRSLTVPLMTHNYNYGNVQSLNFRLPRIFHKVKKLGRKHFRIKIPEPALRRILIIRDCLQRCCLSFVKFGSWISRFVNFIEPCPKIWADPSVQKGELIIRTEIGNLKWLILVTFNVFCPGCTWKFQAETHWNHLKAQISIR